MSRPAENYDSSRKKFVKKKRKRFERPRFRVPVGGEKCRTPTERELRSNSDPDPLSLVEDRSLFSEVASEYVIGDKHKQYEERSSTQEEYFDAQDDKVSNRNKADPISVKHEIKVSLTLKGPFIQVSVVSDDGNSNKSVNILKNDFAKSGVDLKFSTNGDDSPSLTVNSCDKVVFGGVAPDWESGDCQGLSTRVNAEAQTAVVLGTDEITDTEEVSVMCANKERQVEAAQEELLQKSDISLPNDTFMMSETTDENLQSFDSAPLIKSTANSSYDEQDDLESENQVLSKLKTHSTITSIPLDTYSTLEKKSKPDVSIDFSTQNDNQTKEVSSAVPSVPLIKSKSDSLVLSSTGRSKQKCDRGIMARKESSAYPDIFSLMYNKGEEEEWDYQGNRLNLPYCSSNEWFNEKTYPQEYLIEKTESEITEQTYCPDPHYNEEALERPMTSAADAVKSMHQALKPISDQINDIRTKMIGMNIQPRSSSRQRFGRGVIPNIPSQESNFSDCVKINQWLLTDPQEFSNSLTNSDGSLRGYEYLADDFGIVKHKNRHREKLVIFPDVNEFDFNYMHHTNMDDISLTRSSIVTEPDDIFSKSYRGPKKKREM
uniref:Putative rhamnogalacturonase D n=1 Tax=Lygus hesperus TaxID=30085 RepID=A0A0A9YN03_LYGHE